MKKVIQLIILTVIITSCHQEPSLKGYNGADSFMEEEIAPITRQASVAPPPPPAPPITTKEIIKKKIIKDGRIGVKVSDLKSAKVRVDSLVENHKAYYSNEKLNNTDWESSYNLTIRIPSSTFEGFITAIERTKGEILYKEIDARDVTDQFIDLETRLQNKRAYLKRYQDLLKKAQTIKEILAIEEKIRRLEEEIESTTGRLKYLGDLVDYSTLRLNIRKQKEFKYNPAQRDKFSERIKQSLSKGWFGFIDFLLLLTKFWPFWIIGLLIIYFYRKIKRKKALTK
ncbi:DUF4349 domain-containing protein [Carboxylicivirga marina]|uniref:DUF4349 domain-containing protein n=1 Tax=Carboxylicivirga marina TaxID=2800988 RepID=UPI0025996DCB|nr:DUF4349 domain-containing protein [uncultured Carboxylicivirga sp.]